VCSFVLTELASRCRIGEKSLAEWLTIFEGATFPYGPINSIKEVFSDPQVGAVGLCIVVVYTEDDLIIP